MFGWLRRLMSDGSAPPPSPIGRKAGNDAVRAQLLEHGDDGTKVRHVIHFAYPLDRGQPSPKQIVRVAVARDGIAFTEAQDSPGIVFEMQCEVASAEFDTLTERYADMMDAMGWSYDGWECAVATGT